MFKPQLKPPSLILILLSMIFLQNLSAQDEGTVIEISEKIGLELDKKENKRYKIFREIPGFRSATFYQKADSIFWVDIEYYQMGGKETKIQDISREDLNTIIEKIKSGPAKRETDLYLRLKSTSNIAYEGILTKISPHGFTLVLANHKKPKESELNPIEISIQLDRISELSIPRKTPIIYEIGYGTLIPFAIGSISGFLLGDESAESAMFFGIWSASLGLLIGTSVGTLRSIDIDIPWQDKSFDERQNIISDLYTDTYKPPFIANLTSYIGTISLSRGSVMTNYGLRIRTYFTLKTALELDYSQLEKLTGSNSYSKWTKKNEYYYSGFYLLLTKNYKVNPFIAWGWGQRKEYTNEEELLNKRRYNYRDNALFLSMQVGSEIKIWKWVNSELRLRYVWDGIPQRHFGLLIGLTLGPDYF